MNIGSGFYESYKFNLWTFLGQCGDCHCVSFHFTFVYGAWLLKQKPSLSSIRVGKIYS